MIPSSPLAYDSLVPSRVSFLRPLFYLSPPQLFARRLPLSIGCIQAVCRPCGPELAPGHRFSRPRGTGPGSVGDSVGEG